MFKFLQAKFKYSHSKPTVSKWKLNLISVMAKLGGSYNSYYSRIYQFTDLLLKRPVRLEVSTQFFEARVRFKMPVMSVKVWHVDLDLLKSLGFEMVHYFGSQSLGTASKQAVSIYIPEFLSSKFETLEGRLKAAMQEASNRGRISIQEHTGQLTSSGRTFWLDNSDCFKIDTVDIQGVSDFVNNRRLDTKDVKAAILTCEYLQNTDLKNFFTESSGLYIQSSTADYRYVVLERNLDFEKTSVREGDFLIPMQAMVSVDFWANEKTLAAFELNQQTCAQFFENHLAREFARLVKNSIESTFTHFELHQQNITCHIRNGELQKLLVHDLQDVVFDPISYLLATPDEEWSEALRFIRQFSKTKFFNLYGEPRVDGPKHKFFFTPASLYRRYLRNLGNYGRIYNHASGEDYLFSRKFESLILKELNYADEDLGLDAAIKDSANFSFLRDHLFWVIERRVETKQKKLLNSRAKSFMAGSGQPLAELEVAELIKRMQSEMCVFSNAMLLRFESLPLLPDMINQVYLVAAGNLNQSLRNRSAGSVYFIVLKNGENALLLFTR